MPLYLDTYHKVEGLTAEAVAAAHAKDLEVQDKYGVKYLRYWYDQGSGKLLCLCEAPSTAAVEAVHRVAHAGVADEIFEAGMDDLHHSRLSEVSLPNGLPRPCSPKHQSSVVPVEAVHRVAHAGVADEIFEVKEGV